MIKENSSNEELDEKTREYRQDLKDEIMLALITISPDLSPLHRTVIFSIIENELIHKDKESFTSQSIKGEKDFQEECDEEVARFVKEFLLTQKEELIKMTEVAMDSLKAMRLQKFFIYDGKLHGSLLKKIVKLINEMRENKNEDNEEVALNFWIRVIKRQKKKAKRTIKGLVSKIIFYRFEDSALAYKRSIYKLLTRTLERLWRFAWAKNKIQLSGKSKTFFPTTEERGYLGRGEGFMGRGRFRERPMNEVEQVVAEGEMQGNGMLEEINEWHMRFIKKIFKKRLPIIRIKLALNYLIENQSTIDTSYEISKQIVEDYFKEHNLLDTKYEKLKIKTIAEIVCESVSLSEGKKRSKEYFIEFAKNFLAGCFTTCTKECIKRHKKTFKITLLKTDVKDKNVARTASEWGAIMYCKKCKDCLDKDCVEFAKKWIEVYIPVIKEALATLKIFMQGSESNKHKIILTYLKMYCSDGKFNKEYYEKFLNECKERMKKLAENFTRQNYQ